MPRFEAKYEVPRQPCPSCGAALELASTPIADDTAAPGDMTICGYCRAWLVFTREMGLRLAEGAEVDRHRSEAAFEMALAESEADRMIRDRETLRGFAEVLRTLNRARRPGRPRR